MIRKKLYYPSSEIESGLYTSGDEFQLIDGTVYIGQYHRYKNTNEYFTEPEWNKKTSKLLQPIQKQVPADIKLYQQIRPNIKTKFKTPTPVPVKITSNSLKQGYVKRFIFSKINDKTVIESDQLQYEEWQREQIDNNIYTAIEVKWYITGELYDSVINGVITEGIITKNIRIRNLLFKTNPEISEYLSDPLQFYADTSIVIPPDINGLDS
jgi:hypothetical protein